MLRYAGLHPRRMCLGDADDNLAFDSAIYFAGSSLTTIAGTTYRTSEIFSGLRQQFLQAASFL